MPMPWSSGGTGSAALIEKTENREQRHRKQRTENGERESVFRFPFSVSPCLRFLFSVFFIKIIDYGSLLPIILGLSWSPWGFFASPMSHLKQIIPKTRRTTRSPAIQKPVLR